VTANEFRNIALRLPETEESRHMAHPDFRVSGKIFATLGYPERSWGMVKLSPVDQALFIKMESGAFVPVKGAWGRKGATSVHLRSVNKKIMQKALRAAWMNTAAKRLIAMYEEGG
jgi:hypothetical protein